MKLKKVCNPFIFLYGVGLFFFGCGSEPVKVVATSTPLLIETKAQVKTAKDSNNVRIDIALIPNKMIRMEVTAVMGYRVATVLMSPQKIQYAIHSNQTYGEGPFNSRTLFPVFRQNLDPRIIWRVIHGQNPQNPELTCQVDQLQRPVSCNGPRELTVKWTYEEWPQRRIEIKSGEFEMNWLFKSQRVLGDSQAETFVLKKPEGYKEIILK